MNRFTKPLAIFLTICGAAGIVLVADQQSWKRNDGRVAMRPIVQTAALAPKAPVQATALAPTQAPATKASDTPPEASGSWMAEVRENIRKAEYNITWQDNCVIDGAPGGLHAANRANNLRAYFREDGVQIVHLLNEADNEQAHWRYAGISRDGRVQKAADVEPKAEYNRLSYNRGAVSEWYINGGLGIEQGFDIARAPRGDGPLRLNFEVSGDTHAYVGPRGDIVSLRNDEGEDVFTIRELYVFDADNRELPAQFERMQLGYVIAINDSGARYPLKIDPLLTSARWTRIGNQDNASYGETVAGAGDLNGDGFTDVLVGAPYYDGPAGTDSGRVEVYYGSPVGLSSTPDDVLYGLAAFGLFGTAVAGAGDVNGDGFSDVIVGAPGVADDAGYMYLFAGGASGLDTTAVYSLAGVVANDRWGSALDSAGDLDGDGFSDFVVGAPGAGGDGGIGVFFGMSDFSSLGIQNWIKDQDGSAVAFGSSIAGGGDLNGDGYSDFAVGDPKILLELQPNEFGDDLERRGRVHVYHGSSSGINTTPTRVIENPLFADIGAHYFGFAVAVAGDINSDGYSDLVVGAPFEQSEITAGFTTENYVRVFLGSGSGIDSTPWSTTVLSRQFGYSVDSVGDVNGDGFADIIAGRPIADGFINFYGSYDKTGPGGALLLYGGSNPALSSIDLSGLVIDDGFGMSVSGAGDIDGNGLADVVIGAPDLFALEQTAGAAFLFEGNRALPPESATVTGNFDTVLGDVNGDGYTDFASATDVYYGSANLAELTASDWTAPAYPSGVTTELKYLRACGDVNGDGYDDVLVVHGYFVSDELFLRYPTEITIYEGGSNGLSSSFFWTSEVIHGEFGAFPLVLDQIGDVNGDGYGDFALGQYLTHFQNASLEGTDRFVEILVGGASGPTLVYRHDNPFISADEQNSFGSQLSPAGDVNGDTFSDFLYADPLRTDIVVPIDVSRAWLVAGRYNANPELIWSREISTLDPIFTTVSGLGHIDGDRLGDFSLGPFVYEGFEVTPPFIEEFQIADPRYAGDIDGDRVDDFLVGNELYRGGENGAETSFWTTSDAADVYSAGDLNGDGISDFFGDGGQVFLSSTGSLKVPHPRQLHVNGEPLSAHGFTGSREDVKLSVNAFSPMGRSKVRLEWEIKPVGEAFDGTGLERSATWVDSGLLGQQIEVLARTNTFANGHHWRARVLYHPSQNPQQIHGPWYSPKWTYPVACDFRTFEDYILPTPPAVSLGEPPIVTTEDIVAIISTPGVVHPETTLSYEYSWSNGNATYPSAPAPTSDTSSTLPSSLTRKREVWTCTVRTFDGGNYSEAVTASATIANTRPEAPMIGMAPIVGNADTLVCQVTVGSVDDDNDPVSYTFDWFVKRAGQASFSPFTGASDDAVNRRSLVDPADTEPGDLWYCVVTPNDGEADGGGASTQSTPTSVVLGGVTPSSVAASANPASLTLGSVVTFGAEIFPNAGDLSSVTKRFDVVSPVGVALSAPSSSESGNTFGAVFLPGEASEGRSDWQVNAFWSGNSTYTAATSSAKFFEVLKATPEIALSLSASSAPVGFDDLTATAVVSVPGFPVELQPLLSGLSVDLFLRKPDGSSVGPVSGVSDGNGVVTYAPGAFTSAGVAPFNDPGTWQVIADFEGDNNFNAATSVGFDQPDSVRLTIKDRAGYAIICVGKLDQDGEGLEEHTKTAETAYLALRDRGLAHEDIYYLSELAPPNGADILVDDATPSQLDLQNAIQNWALGKMNEAAAPLYLVMLDHGLEEQYYVFSGSFDETRVVSPLELDGYLSSLQNNLTGDAEDQPVVLVYGACNSGSFIPAVSAENRVVITSAAGNEKSHRGPQDPDGVRDGELFVTELFRNLRVGKDFKEAFELASDKIEEFTKSRSNDATGERTQTPLLDDNGDGLGSPAADLSFDTGVDGAAAFELTVGFGLNAGESIGWIEASQTIVLEPSEVLPALFARSQTPVPNGSDAWIEIKKPAYTGSSLADETLSDFQRFVDLPRFFYDGPASDLGSGTFRWPNLDAEFTGAGTYKVFYYVKDGVSGDVSTHLLTTVFREKAGNQAPPATTLTFPADGATVNKSSFYSWTSVTDPDGDPVTYTIQFTADTDFTAFDPATDENDFQVEDIVNTYALIGEAEGIQDGITYQWRVISIDIFGASPNAHEERTVIIDQDNANVPGSLTGVVLNVVNDAPIAGASVLAGSNQRTTQGTGGYAFESLPAGNYSMSVTADGFKAWTGSASVSNGQVTNRVVTLQPGAGFMWGDVTGDAFPGTNDGVELLEWTTFLRDSFTIAPGTVRPSFPPGADTNANTMVDVNDMTQILRLRARITDRLPADTNGDGQGPEAKYTASVTRDKQGARTIQLVPSGEPKTGDPLSVDFTIDDASGIAGYTMELRYDLAVLAYTGFARGALTADWFAALNPNIAGEIVVSSGTGTNAIANGGGSVMTLVFLVEADGVDTGLRIQHAIAYDIDGAIIPLTTDDGRIFTSGTSPVDINGDGMRDAADVQQIINLILNLTDAPEADVNEDGSLDAADIQLVINALLGIL